jgi:acetoin utilization deacetylase AcuC-like enzyme
MNPDDYISENIGEDNIFTNPLSDIASSDHTAHKRIRKTYIVGIVDDKRCELHIQEDGHRESPDRIRAIRQKLKATGLYEKLIHIEPTEPTKEELMLVHTNKYINKVVRICTKHEKGMIDNEDVRVKGEYSLVSAGVAVGGVIAAVNTVLNSKDIRKVFCNIRPPGHHASSHETSGFCIFNNVAIGAKKALQNPLIKRVLIFDWGLHHGDGTERIFKCSKNVMFVSFHRSKPFYPNSGESDFKGKYYNVHNYPQDEDSTPENYMRLFYEDFLPKAKEFNPDIIFISCGFDSHKDDIYGALPLTTNHFKVMTKELCHLANCCSDGRLISVLEGGYILDVIADCAAVHVNELLSNN